MPPLKTKPHWGTATPTRPFLQKAAEGEEGCLPKSTTGCLTSNSGMMSAPGLHGYMQGISWGWWEPRELGDGGAPQSSQLPVGWWHTSDMAMPARHGASSWETWGDQWVPLRAEMTPGKARRMPGVLTHSGNSDCGAIDVRLEIQPQPEQKQRLPYETELLFSFFSL